MKWITRPNLTSLLLNLRGIVGPKARGSLIVAAGVPDNTWLGHCLMYESEAMVWAAWESE